MTLIFILLSCAGQYSTITGNNKMTLEEIVSHCDAGDMAACLKAGKIYRFGKFLGYDTPKNIELATQYYAKGCANQSKEACKDLYTMYWDLYQRNEYARSDPALLKVFETSCNGGYGPACSSLAYNYQKGKGVGKNPMKALALYEKGCQNGSPSGCHYAGDIYEEGKSVSRNPNKAKTFYEKGCNWENAGACTGLGLMYLKGDDVTQDISNAYAYFLRSCSSNPDDNDTEGCFNLAKLYEGGLGCEQDLAKAVALYGQACKFQPKIAEACLKLAQANQTGKGVKTDDNAAWNYFRDACNLGSHEGCVGWHSDGCDRLKNLEDCEWLKKHGLY